MCQGLSVPVATNKVEGPASILTFLDIEIDTVRGEPRLPPDKLDCLRSALQ